MGWVDRSYALHELKRTAEARDNLLRVVDKFPTEATMRYNLACYECQLGRLEEAKTWFQKACDVGVPDKLREMALHDPDLEPLARILFVARQPYEPSHNYSDILDARWRPGGGVCVLEIPRRDGRMEPSAARLKKIFDAQGGVARDAVANWLSRSEKFQRLDKLTAEHGAIMVALTRLVPIFPFNLLNYGFGLTRVPFWTYVFWSWLCMLPATVVATCGEMPAFPATADATGPNSDMIGLFASVVLP